MENLILEEKYKSLLVKNKISIDIYKIIRSISRNKSNHEKNILIKESEALRNKLEKLEGAYIEKEKEVATIIQEKEHLEDGLNKMRRENENLSDEIVKLNERIVDLTDLSKTYRKMIKNRNQELQHSNLLVSENMNLRNIIEISNNEKLEIESELEKKKNIIHVIKDKYKNNISRLLDKFDEKDKDIHDLQTFVVNELHNLKVLIRREKENTFYDDSIRDDTILNISLHLDMIIKKMEEKMKISVAK